VKVSHSNAKLRMFILLCVSIPIVSLWLLGCRSIVTPSHPIPRNRDEAWQQDIAYLKNAFPQHNMSFDDGELDEFDRVVDELYDTISAASDAALIVGIMRSVATAGDVHTHVSLRPSAQKLRRLPIRFYWFSDGLYVIKASAQYSGTLGTRVVELGGVPPHLLLERMRDTLPGNRSSLKYLSSYFLSSPDFLEGIGAIDDSDSVNIVVERLDGSIVEMVLPTMALSPPVTGYQPWRELSPLSTQSQDAKDMRLFGDLCG
jgi:hypothetical protein